MRINLVTPFAEKEAVKALGARWDATKKIGMSSMWQTSRHSCGGFQTWQRPLKTRRMRRALQTIEFCIGSVVSSYNCTACMGVSC